MSWRFKFRLFQASTYAIVLTALIIMALVTGKCIETIGLFVSFVALRNCFGKTYHSKSFSKCILISVIVFVFAITFVPSRNLTILSCIVFGLLIDLVAYKYKDYLDITEALNPHFDVSTCTEAELINRCKQIRLSEENTNLAIDFFIKKIKQSEIAERLCIDEKSVQTRKTRLKAKLNKF